MAGFDVFLSYSSLDTEIADTLCKTLEAKGIPCWIAPRNITPGMHWGEAIIEGINASKIMVVVFSDNSNKSQQVLREVERAVSKGLYVLPFRVQPTLPSKAMEYFLSTTHWFNALTTPIEVHAERLVDLVRSIIAQTAPMEEASAGSISQAAATEAAPAEVKKDEPPPIDKMREQIALVLSHAQETCALGRQAVDGMGVNSEIIKEHFKSIETTLAGKDLPVSLIVSDPQLLEPTLTHLGIQIEGGVESVVASGGVSARVGVSADGKKLDGMTIQVVLDPSRLMEDAALANRLVTDAALLIFAAEAKKGFAPQNLPLLREMARHSSTAVVVHGSASSGAVGEAWNDELLKTCEGLSLPIEFTEAPPDASSLRKLFGVGEVLRLLVHLFDASHRLWDATVLAADERQQLVQSLKVNQATKRKEIAFIDAQGLRSASPEVVQRVERIDAQLAGLVGSIEKLNQRALAPGGRLHSSTRKLVQGVTTEDLKQEAKTSPGVIFKDEKLKSLSATIRMVAAEQLRSATKLFNDGVAIALDEELGGEGAALRVRELVRGVARPNISEVAPDSSLLKSHYRGEIKVDEGTKPGRFRIFKKFMRAVLDLSPFVQPAQGALSWEIQLFAKEILDRSFSSYKTTAEGIRRAVRAGMGAIPDDGIQQRRKELEEKLATVDTNLLGIEGRARDIQDLQQACAEVDSECRAVVREVIKPVFVEDEVKEAVNG